MDSINEIEYKINDLKTRSVVLFPTRAQIHREIKNVNLKAGINEITIVGLTPTLDEDSVKVEGSGSAIITDISIESLPNQEIFEDVFPEEEDSEDDLFDDLEFKDSAALKASKDKLTTLKDSLHRLSEEEANAHKRLSILDSYAASLDSEKNDDIAKFLGSYKQSRESAFEDSIRCVQQQRELQQRVNDAFHAVTKLQKVEDKIHNKERKEREKEIANQARRRAKKIKEQARIKKERYTFWPKTCYSIKITLDVSAATPMSSRRNSVSSQTEVFRAAPDGEADEFDDATKCDLVLSYITASAWWTPSYDMQLSTTNSNATLCFDAQLRNHTSETWKNCKITLSTSEATFSDLNSTIPKLLPWRIRLGNKRDYHGVTTNQITHSSEELKNRQMNVAQKKKQTTTNVDRGNLFGRTGAPQTEYSQWDGNMDQQQYQQQNRPIDTSLFASNSDDRVRSVGGGLFGSSQSVPPPPQLIAMAPAAAISAPGGGGGFGESFRGSLAAAAPLASAARFRRRDSLLRGALEQGEKLEVVEDLLLDVEPPTEEGVDFEDSLMDTSGLTTTHDLPGLKTLAPKSTASKQRVARINFSSVVFSHTIVAKYQPVAYLKAKLKNGSKYNLMPGSAGLTLDDSFMGRTKIPRCSAGDSFTLGLGIDPAIKISYPKPDIRRATTGVFSKENNSVYARAIVINNTRVTSSKPVNMLVLDQVPVSEDDRLKVVVVTPTGLVMEGGYVATGAPLRDGDRDRDWGKASAKFKKTGLINWDVNLNAGKAVKLWLEYAVVLPVGDFAVEC